MNKNKSYRKYIFVRDKEKRVLHMYLISNNKYQIIDTTVILVVRNQVHNGVTRFASVIDDM